VVDLDRPHKVDDKTGIVPSSRRRLVSLPGVSEGVVVAYDDLLDPDFFHQDRADKVPGRDRGKISVKGHADDDIDARLFNEFELLTGMGD